MAKLSVALIYLILIGDVSYAEDGKPWRISFSSNIGQWEAGGVDNSGSQSVAYSQLSYDGGAWGALITGSYVDTSYQTEDMDEKFEVSTFTDAALSTYFLWDSGKLAVRGGVDVSSPTGKSSFTSDELQMVITDDLVQDLMLLNSYGAGLGIRPHLSMTYSIGSVTWGLGLKYVYADEYDPTTDIEDDNFDPGDSATSIVSALYTISKTNYLMALTSYTSYNADKLGGETIFRNGDRYSLEARYIKRWSDTFRNTFSLILSGQEKNELIGENGALTSETGNSNANSIKYIINSAYSYSQRLTLLGILGYKQVNANNYVGENSLKDAGRNIMFLEPGVIWMVNKNIYVSGKLRYKSISDKKDAFSPSDTTYNVLNLDLNVMYSF